MPAHTYLRRQWVVPAIQFLGDRFEHNGEEIVEWADEPLEIEHVLLHPSGERRPVLVLRGKDGGIELRVDLGDYVVKAPGGKLRTYSMELFNEDYTRIKQ